MPFFLLPNLPKVLPYADLRERFERRLDRDFDRSLRDNRSDLFSRWRVGTHVTFSKAWKGQLELQYAHDLAWTPARNFSAENRDMSLGYLEGQERGWTVDIGRQKINVGQQRLIGAFEWNNVSRSFDAVRARTRDWDFFAGKVGMQSPYPPNARIAAAYRTDKRVGNSLYVFKHDSGVDVHTIDHSLGFAAGAVSFDAEGALQAGKENGRTQEAWAIHLGATMKPRSGFSPFAVVDVASGGPSTGTSRTFDNLYPTNHGKFGIADMAGWRNIQHLAAGIDFTPRKNLGVRLAWHNLALRDARDAWYAASGAPNKHGAQVFQDPTGSHGHDLGNEFDLEVTGSIQSHSLSAGVALFKPGSFVSGLTGHGDDQVFGYFQISTRF